MTVDKTMNVEFITGYAFKAIENYVAKETDAFRNIPDCGVQGDVVFPKVWVNESFDHRGFELKMESVMQRLTDVFQIMYGSRFQLFASWEEYVYQRNHIAINFRFMKRAPKKMTVAEIEKKLGYKIEIVSEE